MAKKYFNLKEHNERRKMIPHLLYYPKPFSSYNGFKNGEKVHFGLSFTIGGQKMEYLPNLATCISKYIHPEDSKMFTIVKLCVLYMLIFFQLQNLYNILLTDWRKWLKSQFWRRKNGKLRGRGSILAHIFKNIASYITKIPTVIENNTIYLINMIV